MIFSKLFHIPGEDIRGGGARVQVVVDAGADRHHHPGGAHPGPAQSLHHPPRPLPPEHLQRPHPFGDLRHKVQRQGGGGVGSILSVTIALCHTETHLASESEEHIRLAETGGGGFPLFPRLPLLAVFCQRGGGGPDLVPLRPPGHLPSPGLDHDYPGSKPSGLAPLRPRHWRILSAPEQIGGPTGNTDSRLEEAEDLRPEEGPDCWTADPPDLRPGAAPGCG